MEQILLNTSPSYAVSVGEGFIVTAGELLKKLTDAEKVMIVSDENVFDLYGKKLLSSLREEGFRYCAFIMKPGEGSKSPSNLFALWNALAENGFTREDTVLSLGGGVVSDLGGFAAATFMRGIRHVIFSTTLLSMADASVGGKTAVDLKAGKNMAGAFYEPAAVFCDTSALSTLPKRLYADGMAEIIKCGMIRSEELLFSLYGDPSSEEMIAKAIRIKKEFVEADEKDLGARHLLNFGHTLAHAAEKLSGGKLSHGRAVAAGMYLTTRASAANGLCTPVTLDFLGKLLDKYELPKSFPFTVRELCAAAMNDKKREGDFITLVVPEGLGKAALRKLPADRLYDFYSE